MKKRKELLIMTICMLLLSLFPVYSVGAEESQTEETITPEESQTEETLAPEESQPEETKASQNVSYARHEKIGDEIFLGGKYIEMGISKGGSFGTESAAPIGFHPTGRPNLGFTVDSDGFDSGEAMSSGDYFLPGSPYEGFYVGYKESDDSTKVFLNANALGSKEILMSTNEDLSTEDNLVAKTSGVTSDGALKIEQTVSFKANDKFFKATVKMTNMTDRELLDVRYMRSVDPDIDADKNDIFDTINSVPFNYPYDGKSVVLSKGPITGNALILMSTDSKSRASINSSNPFDPTAFNDGGKVAETTNDSWVGLTFAVGKMIPGESKTVEYFYSLDSNIEQTLEDVENNSTPTVSNNATLSDLTVNDTTVSEFASEREIYNVELPAHTTTVPKVIATVTDKDKASAVVTNATSLPGTTTIVVTAEDGITTKTYTINFTVKNIKPTVSNNATLSDLTVNATTVSEFASEREIYNVELPVHTTTVPKVIATVTDKDKASAVVTNATSLPGTTTIVVTAEDRITTKTYTINFTVEKSSSGGGTWTPNTSPPTTNLSTTTTKIQVALEIVGDNPLEKTTVEIERTKHANGEVTDFVNLIPMQALEAVEKAKQTGNNIARIVIPDVNDEVDKVTIEVSKQSLQTLRDNGLSLEISTENGQIAIPHSSMEGIDDNFYFRLVPVKKESERQAIEERARVEKVVRETLQSNDVRVVARPMTIETNMPNRPVQVTLPLRDVKVPTEAAARQTFLEQLVVFIEHSDGEKKVVFPEVVTMAKGELGLRFTVDKFSTFTIIQFEKPEVNKHEAYIKGFPNGTFGPDKNVTRAQVAIMMARILGYKEGQTVSKAPFKDVAKDHSAAGAIAFVKEQGIMHGDQHGNFHANANITRAEMAAVVANYKKLFVEEGVAITFKDTKGHWAQWIIEANRAAGIINGLENGSFVPNAALTRAQAVVMMNRMFERGPLHGVTKPSFPDVKATHWAFKEIEEAANAHSYMIDEDGKEQLSK
ncbi:cell surface glycoprotein [Lysinibacillus fusiformis]|uniref:S-layer homology domain-containing protein n=2 Tax=Lysinibacillus fusiformis TaxID=28031 RepID=UPI000D34E4FB|nr:MULTISPECIES: S-layer homology domain-containing protein [Lysinibacillus]MED4669820.1 S-layer homology domain-containing protein [Lysinibacillus fusiformis]QAS55687.1 cell surface glycoprotein [Lysinibacillus sphaericus]RDV27722.1 cell surface glycoprotein [Lysinibacillus fusiformis]